MPLMSSFLVVVVAVLAIFVLLFNLGRVIVLTRDRSWHWVNVGYTIIYLTFSILAFAAVFGAK